MLDAAEVRGGLSFWSFWFIQRAMTTSWARRKTVADIIKPDEIK